MLESTNSSELLSKRLADAHKHYHQGLAIIFCKGWDNILGLVDDTAAYKL